MLYSSISIIQSARGSAIRVLLRSLGGPFDDSRIQKTLWLLLVGILLMGGCAGETHMWTTEDLEVKKGSTTQVQWTRNGHATELKMRGDVTVAGSLDDIQSVPANGYFELTETNGRTQRLRVVPTEETAAEESLSYRYTVDGQSQPFGKEERRWLRRTLHEVARKTGIGVEQRVAYLFEKGGGDAVFEEVRQVDSDLGTRHYYSALVRLEAAPMTVADRVLRRATQRLDSDFQKRQLLEDVADRYVGAPDHFDVYEEAMRTVDSDYQRRQALTHLVARTNLAPAQHEAVLELIAGIDSDYQTRQVLTALSSSSLTGAHADTFSRLFGEIDSEYQKRQALSDLLGRDDLSANQLVAFLEQAQRMETGRDKIKLLREVEHLHTHDDPAVRKAYREAAVSIVATENS